MFYDREEGEPHPVDGWLSAVIPEGTDVNVVREAWMAFLNEDVPMPWGAIHGNDTPVQEEESDDDSTRPWFDCEGPTCGYCGSSSRFDRSWTTCDPRVAKCPVCNNMDCGGGCCRCRVSDVYEYESVESSD